MKSELFRSFCESEYTLDMNHHIHCISEALYCIVFNSVVVQCILYRHVHQFYMYFTQLSIDKRCNKDTICILYPTDRIVVWSEL